MSKSNEQNRSHRASVADRDHEFNVLGWLTEGASGVASELKRCDLGLSEKFWTHSYNARREGLLAARAVLDQIIERGERSTTKQG